ncbi:MAG: glutamate 5-kinase [Porphyromonadaceae bacterium]|jgi:glutamate 5-kinase|nr:glutamate 5-kinase [Porphyromonadaceae bacterium]
MRYNKIAVKVGSNVLTRTDGTLDVTRMSALVDQISFLFRKGVKVILISSGAVASGRSVLKPSKKLDIVEQRQLFSTIGQAKLINHYYELFRNHNIVVGQVLTTKTNFDGRVNYLNQRNCMSVMLNNCVIPIVNENDAVSVSELMFTDNDELSGMIASMMGVQALVILSNVDGVYDGAPKDSGSKVIREIKRHEKLSDFIQNSKSEFGRGGMQTKVSIAQKIADEGIDVIIANGKKEDILIDLLDSEKDTVSTLFRASKIEVSGVKKWLAHSDDFAKGKVYINENAEKALSGSNAVSLLPVGITKISGVFEKDDIIKIFSEKEKFLGVGKAQFNSEKANQIIGKKNQRPLVHYDYLYLD